MRNIVVLVLTITISTLLLACASSPASAPPVDSNPVAPETAQPPPAPAIPSAPVPITQPAAKPLSVGQELYVAKGCSACHGQDGVGSDFAPALGGHNAAQVKRQARAPLGLMPIFPPDKISNEELNAIAEYIDGLEGGHAHGRTTGSGEELAIHHWMALFAIEAEDVQEATHHVHHIMEITKGLHLARMEDTLIMIESGEAHEAGHIIETMLAGIEQNTLDEPTMHLKLALSSTRVDELVIATHHVEHYLGLVAGQRHEAGEEVLDFLLGDRLLEAEHGLEQMLGGDVTDDAEVHDDATNADPAHDEEEEEGHDDGDGA